jgi:hypothetical protein
VRISVPFAFLVQIGKDEPFPLQFAFVSEVDEVAYGLSGDPHVVEQVTVHALGAFFRKIDLDMNAVFEDDMHHVVRQSKSAHDSART